MGSRPELGLDSNANTPKDEYPRWLSSGDNSVVGTPTREDAPQDSNGELWPRDQQQKTATYDYAFEKSMSHAEAKLFYQHHQLASQSGDKEKETMSTVPASPVPTNGSMVESEDHLMSSSIHSRGSSMLQDAEWYPASQPQSGGDGIQQPNSAQIAAELAARNQTPFSVAQSPHISASESLHGPGLTGAGLGGAAAGLGLGVSGVNGAAPAGDVVSSELSAIYRKIQGLLERRAKYIELSLQRPEDDPRNKPDWNLYPPPPEPAWDDGKEYQPGNAGGPSDFTEKKKRKMGEDIGEDFDLEELMPVPGPSDWSYRLDRNSVYQVYESEDAEEPAVHIPSLRDFYMDLDAVVDVSTDGPAKSFAFKRLSYLEGKYQLYTLLNEYQEVADSKKVPHRDFYNVRKVDTHVHHSACMNQKHLLRFIKSKMRKSPDEVVLFRDGKHLTLREVFESIKLTAYDLSIDTLDMHVRLSPCFTYILYSP